MNIDNFNMQQIIDLELPQLFTWTSFKIYSGFNSGSTHAYPEVGYINQFTIWIRAFTRIQFSFIQFKCPV